MCFDFFHFFFFFIGSNIQKPSDGGTHGVKINTTSSQSPSADWAAAGGWMKRSPRASHLSGGQLVVVVWHVTERRRVKRRIWWRGKAGLCTLNPSLQPRQVFGAWLKAKVGEEGGVSGVFRPLQEGQQTLGLNFWRLLKYFFFFFFLSNCLWTFRILFYFYFYFYFFLNLRQEEYTSKTDLSFGLPLERFGGCILPDMNTT